VDGCSPAHGLPVSDRRCAILHQLAVEVELVKYMGKGHVIRQPAHRDDYRRRTLAWFDRHLRS